VFRRRFRQGNDRARAGIGHPVSRWKTWGPALALVCVALLAASRPAVALDPYLDWSGPTRKSWEGVCRHKALYILSVMAEKHLCRVAYGTAASGRKHVETMCMIDGLWHWMEVHGKVVKTGLPPSPTFEVTRYYTSEEYARRLMNHWADEEPLMHQIRSSWGILNEQIQPERIRREAMRRLEDIDDETQLEAGQ